MEDPAGQREELRLRYRSGPERGRTVSFRGPQIRIGRSRDNDWLLPESHFPTSSGHHAEARYENGVWWLIDLESTNGTWINGRAVSRQRLRRGDRIRFGHDPILQVVSGPRTRRWLTLAAAGPVLLALGAAALWWCSTSPGGLESRAQSAAQSVYLIAVERGAERHALATAFAVRRPGVLATSAHVVIELRRLGALPPGGSWRGIAVRGDSDGRGLPLRAARIHPDYDPAALGYDSALLFMAHDRQLVPLELESLAEVEKLRRGTPLAALGFPKDATDPWRPRARLTQDALGDRRGRYLVVSLGIAPGTSGSPIFNTAGRVIGIVAAGNFDLPLQERPRASHWGITISALVDLLQAGRPNSARSDP